MNKKHNNIILTLIFTGENMSEWNVVIPTIKRRGKSAFMAKTTFKYITEKLNKSRLHEKYKNRVNYKKCYILDSKFN